MNDHPTTQIAVLDRGFVYVGRCQVADSFLTIRDAQCIRRWGTTSGLGQLAADGPQSATKLDPAGTVRAPLSSLMHLIDCDASMWAEALGAAA